MAISNCLFSPNSENLLAHSSHFVLVSLQFAIFGFASASSLRSGQRKSLSEKMPSSRYARRRQ